MRCLGTLKLVFRLHLAVPSWLSRGQLDLLMQAMVVIKGPSHVLRSVAIAGQKIDKNFNYPYLLVKKLNLNGTHRPHTG